MSRSLEAAGRHIALDKEGYLEDLADWTPTVAEALAEHAGLRLSAAHWEVITLLREFHAAHGHSPAMRALVKLMSRRGGPDKGSSLYLLRLFPGSPAKLAARIAGLPRPTNCL